MARSKTEYPPNPLLCGCGVKGVEDLDDLGTTVRYKNLHVSFCPLHALAPEMLKALKPFAAFGKYAAKYPRRGLSDILYSWDGNTITATVRMSDLIRALHVVDKMRGIK